MTVLNIYKEEDLHYSNQLSSLYDGYHYVGREAPIICNDKRISRKHARIVVHRNGAIIESVHVNPTYFKSSVCGTIQLLREHDALSLNNGDCFALVEDARWFRVKIDRENNDGVITNDLSYNTFTNKRGIDEDIPESNKRIKIEPNNSLDTTVESTDFTNINNIETNQPGVNSTTTVDTAIDDNIVNNQNIPIPTDINIEDTNLHSIIAENTANTSDQNIANTSNIKTEQLDLESNLHEPPMPLPLPEIKQEPLNVESSLDEPPMPLPLPEIKLEPPDELNNPTSTNNGNNQGINTGLPDINPGPDEPSSSTNNIPVWKKDHPDWRRDRCWYGKDCYRKNPLHKQDLSHPGDIDYDSDPNDNRPICPFGRSCYRFNIQHRREYKHFGKPAPKPNINIQVHVNGCSCCNRDRRKPDYESDYDDTDPE